MVFCYAKRDTLNKRQPGVVCFVSVVLVFTCTSYPYFKPARTWGVISKQGSCQRLKGKEQDGLLPPNHPKKTRSPSALLPFLFWGRVLLLKLTTETRVLILASLLDDLGNILPLSSNYKGYVPPRPFVWGSKSRLGFIHSLLNLKLPVLWTAPLLRCLTSQRRAPHSTGPRRSRSPTPQGTREDCFFQDLKGRKGRNWLEHEDVAMNLYREPPPKGLNHVLQGFTIRILSSCVRLVAT